MRHSRPLALAALLALCACGGSPPRPEPVPELTLNLPRPGCVCEQDAAEDGADFTFLERGVAAMIEGEYLESLQYFQRYQRIEQAPVADIEARIAIAYLSILPDSPIFDAEAVGASYRRIRREQRSEWQLHEHVRVMQASLESFLSMQTKLSELRHDNENLSGELRRQEEAIKRLRDLTLGREPR